MKHENRLLAIIAVAFVVLSGCTKSSNSVPSTTDSDHYLMATIDPTQGNTVRGEVRFYKVDGGVRVVANLEGLSPGQHGFHLHENGDCAVPEATSAGAHYNPAGTPHGGPTAAGTSRHMGDFGNIEAGADGKATFDRVDDALVYDDLKGLAILVHADPDDLITQPTGNAGARIGCGVIREHLGG